MTACVHLFSLFVLCVVSCLVKWSLSSKAFVIRHQTGHVSLVIACSLSLLLSFSHLLILFLCLLLLRLRLTCKLFFCRISLWSSFISLPALPSLNRSAHTLRQMCVYVCLGIHGHVHWLGVEWDKETWKTMQGGARERLPPSLTLISFWHAQSATRTPELATDASY